MQNSSLNSPMARETKLSDVSEISNACLCTLGYHAHQVSKLDISWFAHYNGGHKCPAGHSHVLKRTKPTMSNKLGRYQESGAPIKTQSTIWGSLKLAGALDKVALGILWKKWYPWSQLGNRSRVKEGRDRQWPQIRGSWGPKSQWGSWRPWGPWS